MYRIHIPQAKLPSRIKQPTRKRKYSGLQMDRKSLDLPGVYKKDSATKELF
jgi:hypothetical protein